MTAQASALSPTGELAEIFTPFSEYTELQREDALNAIRDQVEEWSMPLYEVSRDCTTYEQIFSAPKTVSCIVYIKDPDADQLNLLRKSKI